MRSVRSYQREIQTLKHLVTSMQFVRPMYNGNYSCACCGNPQHWGCTPECEAATISGSPREVGQ